MTTEKSMTEHIIMKEVYGSGTVSMCRKHSMCRRSSSPWKVAGYANIRLVVWSVSFLLPAGSPVRLVDPVLYDPYQ